VQILWWLAPPVVATVLAMLWVSWLGREGRGAVDPEVAARRLGRAMSRPSRVQARPNPTSMPARSDRSSGIAVRSPSRPVPAGPQDAGQEAGQESAQKAAPEQSPTPTQAPVTEAVSASERESTRRAS
jgi:hypothetical protein